MYDFHKDKKRYFNFQYWTARDYIRPFLVSSYELSSDMKVLEVGCAEAGVLKAFAEKGHECLGIELHDGRIELAKEFLKEHYEAGMVAFINRDIYDIDIDKDLGSRYDLIILKDVIEHIPNQERVIPRLKEFLKEDGKIFFGFPPWYMPFGGHQQISSSKVLRALPWFHLLPRFLYQSIIRFFGERERIEEELLEIKATGISIERFERIVRDSGLRVRKRQFFFTNPIYKYKFGLRVMRQPAVLSYVPFLRNFYTTAVYYIIEKK